MSPAAQPATIGRYQVIQALGQGGMGTVYLAEDPLLKRRLAIKVVRASGEAKELALARFKREAEISAQFNHPNVVMVFDVGVDAEAGPFLAMEYVEGLSLARHIDKKDLDTEAKVRVLIQAMRALKAAHKAAIVHRDVKPENILLGPENRAKLMDFGIAGSLSQLIPEAVTVDPEHLPNEMLETQALRLTSTGEFLGSPIYTAPEVLRGSPGTPGSDRYSFAATAFEVLTGCLPHPGSTLPAILSHVLAEPPFIPPDVHPPLAAVFRRALSQDPEERQANLVDFIEELIDALPEPVAVRSRLFAFLNQEENTGIFGGPSRRLTDSGFGSPLPAPAAAAAKKPQSKILLDDKPDSATVWGTGKVSRNHLRSRDEDGFPWLKIIGYTVLFILAIELYWFLRPRLGLP